MDWVEEWLAMPCTPERFWKPVVENPRYTRYITVKKSSYFYYEEIYLSAVFPPKTLMTLRKDIGRLRGGHKVHSG